MNEPIPIIDVATICEHCWPSHLAAALRDYADSRLTFHVQDERSPAVYILGLYSLNHILSEGYILAGIREVARRGIAQSLLVIDYTHEGPRLAGEEGLFSIVSNNLQSAAIPGKRVVFAQANSCLHTSYARWARQQQIRPMNIMVCNAWLLGCGRVPSEAPVTPPPPAVYTCRPERRFLFLNYWPRYHRVYALLRLLRDGILERGFVSFPGFRISDSSIDFRADALVHRATFDPDGSLTPNLDLLEGRCPLVVDSFFDNKSNNRERLESICAAASYYRHSCFSLVGESCFGEGSHERWITEKSLKPIANCHPFLILGSPGSLRELRSLGFHTFAPWIDESYDRITNQTQRFTAVMDEVLRLATLPDDEMDHWQEQVAPVVAHNYEHFIGNFKARCQSKFLRPLIEHFHSTVGLQDGKERPRAVGHQSPSPFDEGYYEHGARGGYKGYRFDNPDQQFQLRLKFEAIDVAGSYDSILFIGCAKGFEVKYFAHQGKQAFGVDISEYAITHVEPEVATICELYDGVDLSRFETDSFDVVAAFDVLILIPPEKRQLLIAEMIRIASQRIIFRTIVKNWRNVNEECDGVDGLPFRYETFDYWCYRFGGGDKFRLNWAKVHELYETMFYFRRR